MLYSLRHRLLLSPFVAFCLCLLVVSVLFPCLDEDCNPGWRDCGGPPAFVWFAEDDELAVSFCSLATRPLGQTALGAKKNATPATEFTLYHHFAQPVQSHLRKTRSTTRQKCSLPRRIDLGTSKVLRLPNSNALSENIAKDCACQKRICDTSPNTRWRLPRETSKHPDTSAGKLSIGHIAIIRTVEMVAKGCRRLDGCERLDSIKRKHFYPETPESNGNLCYVLGNTWINEYMYNCTYA